ncbi:hypothetical protein T265_08909 [Opisthorchis viverrini]|uniref:Uncharacterized protein n=1 Tax=Opisthorchis viverrini TaxID=6198 RepID=A0A074Z7H6_OPIVI|nr:hypothetical protein T265_08909 [Opisthorchis viverrini]KER23141.1 hypothetical protein T265_08909 [Opisthorchis viverrini]
METRELHLPDEPQQGQNRSWVVEEFSATLDKGPKEPEERQRRLPAVGIQGLVAVLITSSELDQPKFFPRLSLELVVGGVVTETKTTVVDPKVLFNGKFCEKEQYVPVDPDVPVFPRPERRLLILHYFHEAPVIFEARKIDDTLSPAPSSESGQNRTSPAYVKVRIEQKKVTTQIPVVEGDEKWITIGWAKLHCYEEYIPADGPQPEMKSGLPLDGPNCIAMKNTFQPMDLKLPANGQAIYQIEKGTREDLFPETEWPQNICSEWTTDGPYKFYENDDNVLTSRKLLLLRAGSQLSATIFNPETDRPDTILPVIKKVIKHKPAAVHKEHALKPLNIPVMEQDSSLCVPAYLWRRCDISFSVKHRVYNATVRSMLLYGSENRPRHAEDVKRLSVFDHRCLRSIALHWISNSEVHRMVFERNNLPLIDELITLHRLRWLGHVLRMPADRIPRRALFAQPREGWKRARGGQTMTWQRSMKAITSKLSCAGHCHLPGWGPRDGPHQWLETLSDMTQPCPQWRSCIQAIAFNA